MMTFNNSDSIYCDVSYKYPLIKHLNKELMKKIKDLQKYYETYQTSENNISNIQSINQSIQIIKLIKDDFDHHFKEYLEEKIKNLEKDFNPFSVDEVG